MIKALVLALVICGLASAVPTVEEVHLPIPEYTEHKWYSGKLFLIQDISTLQLKKTMELSTMCYSIHSTTLIMIPSFFGSMEVLAAPV